MEQLLSYILSHIVEDIEEVKIEKQEIEGVINFNIFVPDSYKGIIIGKGGMNIKAIRQIIGIIAKREGQKVRINIAD